MEILRGAAPPRAGDIGSSEFTGGYFCLGDGQGLSTCRSGHGRLDRNTVEKARDLELELAVSGHAQAEGGLRSWRRGWSRHQPPEHREVPGSQVTGPASSHGEVSTQGGASATKALWVRVVD